VDDVGVPFGSFSFTGTPAFLHAATVDLAGAVADGDVWTLNLNGVEFSYTVTAGDTLELVAEKLRDAVNDSASSFTATTTGSMVTVDRTDDVPFAVSITKTTTDADGLSTTESGGAVTGTDFSITHFVQVDITLEGRDLITEGNTWALTLNGDEFSFVAPAIVSASRPDAVDVRLTDDDAPGVLITQVGGSTTVVEPSDSVVLGSGSAR
jgi:hypothetical protein